MGRAHDNENVCEAEPLHNAPFPHQHNANHNNAIHGYLEECCIEDHRAQGGVGPKHIGEASFAGRGDRAIDAEDLEG